MKYTEFRNVILEELRIHVDGFTWKELKERLSLPYKTPCPTWIKQLETEAGLEWAPGVERNQR